MQQTQERNNVFAKNIDIILLNQWVSPIFSIFQLNQIKKFTCHSHSSLTTDVCGNIFLPDCDKVFKLKVVEVSLILFQVLLRLNLIEKATNQKSYRYWLSEVLNIFSYL